MTEMLVKDKRAAILEATLDLVAENGFHGAPMSAIARQAGVSAGIIYHYFESKDDLIDELYLEVKKEILSAILLDYSPDVSVYESFRRLWLNMFHFYLDHPKYLAFMEQYDNSPYFRPELEAAYAEYYLPLAQLIGEAVERGEIKHLERPVMDTFTHDAALSIAKKYARNMDQLDEKIIEGALNASWDAIKA